MIAYEYTSVLAKHIRGFVAEKQSMGYKYYDEEKWLRQFDRWWIEEHGDAAELTKERPQGWCRQRPTEGASHQYSRICVIRQLALYLHACGIEAWVPDYAVHVPRPAVHVLSQEEISAFFTEIDALEPAARYPEHARFIYAYRVLFRLYLTTGLRNGEAIPLTMSDVDLEKGTLIIRDAKKNKDRIVYMSDDMTAVVRDYMTWLTEKVPENDRWLFPGRKTENHMNGHSVSSQFKICWQKTPYAGCPGKQPTPHSLRHTYVVLRINAWMREGRELGALMPYLSKSLGHSSPSETYYYFHQVFDSLELVSERDTRAASIIPEVMIP